MATSYTNDDPDNLDDQQAVSGNLPYSDDLEAEYVAETTGDPEDVEIDENETPVTSGEMKIGDLDQGERENDRGNEESYDEEQVAGSDNVVDN